jgi:hypothetical protein
MMLWATRDGRALTTRTHALAWFGAAAAAAITHLAHLAMGGGAVARYNARMGRVASYMAQRGFPPDLARRVKVGQGRRLLPPAVATIRG